MVELLIAAVGIFAFGLFSRPLAMSALTAPMVFTGIGLLVGGAGLGWFDLKPDGETTAVLVEATLVLVLFTDASRIDLRVLREESALPARLLGLGLPMTVVSGTVMALLIFDQLDLTQAALVAAVLAPTDAALGRAVVSDPRLPVRIRQTLNVESGLNDGAMLPLVTVLLALAAEEAQTQAGSGAGQWLAFVAGQLGFGLVCGVLIGAVGAWVLHRQAQAGRVEGIYRQLATLAIAAGAYAGAELVGGNGFVAAFVAGLAFGRVAPHASQDVADFTEDEGELLSSLTFLVFGAVIASPRLGDLTWQILLYAVCSLTIVRMLPVLISLLGSGTRMETRLFLGWFGPRGLASILFALLVLDDLDDPQTGTIVSIAVWTVLISIFAHGVSASGWSARLSRRLHSGPAEMPEKQPFPELPTRRKLP